MSKDSKSEIGENIATTKNILAQSFEQSCLVVCLFRLYEVKMTKKLERKIFIEGITAKRGTYYTLAIAEAFSKFFKKNPTIIVEMKKYAQYLKSVKKSLIEIESKKILNCLVNFETPFIVYIDNYVIGNIVHEPHFIVVEKFLLKGKVKIFDPSDGMEKIFSLESINKSVGMLKMHLFFSPIILAKKS